MWEITIPRKIYVQIRNRNCELIIILFRLVISIGEHGRPGRGGGRVLPGPPVKTDLYKFYHKLSEWMCWTWTPCQNGFFLFYPLPFPFSPNPFFFLFYYPLPIFTTPYFFLFFPNPLPIFRRAGGGGLPPFPPYSPVAISCMGRGVLEQFVRGFKAVHSQVQVPIIL